MDRRRLLVAAITVVGVLAVGIGTASAATGMRPPERRHCPVIYKADMIQASGVQDSSKMTIEPWLMRRCHFPTTSSSTTPPMTIEPSPPGTIVCITAPCCPGSTFCKPPVPPSTSSSTVPPISVPKPPICPKYMTSADATTSIQCPTCPPWPIRALDTTGSGSAAAVEPKMIMCPLATPNAVAQ